MRKLLHSEKLRFLLIGGYNTVFLYVLFTASYLALGEQHYLLAYVLSYVVALVSGYILQRIIVFRVKGNVLIDFFRYSLVQLTAFLVNLALLPLLVEFFHLNPLVAQGIIIVITVVGSYFAHRYFSFRRKILKSSQP